MVTLLRLLIRILIPFLRLIHRPWRPGGPIECLVVGYGGANNTGAEARAAEAIRQMLAADPRMRITLTSLDRESTLRYVSEGERLSVAGINPIFIFSMARLVSRSDVVVLAEGSCFKENFSPALLWFFMYSAEIAQRLRIPVVAYGVDAGPLSGANARWARGVAQWIDLLMVRTAAARARLCEIGVERPIEVTTDTAFTLVPEGRGWAEEVLSGEGIDLQRPVVGIAFEELFWWPVVAAPFKAILGVREDRYRSIYYHSWGTDGRRRSAEMKRAVSAYADWAAEELGAQVAFFAMERLDMEPCRDAISMMGGRAVLLDADRFSASQMAALLRRLDWLVTCRYHALVLSMGGLVPAIGLGHDERIESIMDEMEMLHDFFIAFEERGTFDLLREKTRLLLRDPGAIRRRIEAVLPSYLERDARNGELFAGLVSEKFPKKG